MKKISIKGVYSEFCMIPPHPDLREKLFKEYQELKNKNNKLTPYEFLKSKRMTRPPVRGLDDNFVGPQTSSSSNANEASGTQGAASIQLPKFFPKGSESNPVNLLFLLVDFKNKKGNKVQQERLKKLLTGNDENASYNDRSLKQYYREVSYGDVNIYAHVSDWITLDQDYEYYTAGDGMLESSDNPPKNARGMVEQALLKTKGQKIPWEKLYVYNGMIAALCVVHAGEGAERKGPGSGNIWSHKYHIREKWVVPDYKKIYAFTYLTVPQNAELGVIAHEMGHLLFGWPDLYDSEPNGIRKTEGLGNWCLMASGSWNNNGSTPAFPSAWCRYVQGWTRHKDLKQTNKPQPLDVKSIEKDREVYRILSKMTPPTEYFMMENRQQVGFDKHLPGKGILIYHIDEIVPNNWNEDHLAVRLIQADGKDDLQSDGGFFRNRGDSTDPFTGENGSDRFGVATDKSGVPTNKGSVSYVKKNGKHIETGIRVLVHKKKKSTDVMGAIVNFKI